MLTSALVATLLAAVVTTGAPTTTNNDDSCDIGTAPAATLLLPFFEVEAARRSTDVLFTVVNTSHRPQITRVTIWTDWSFPVLSFDLFLTGHDVQGLSIYDIIIEGKLPPGCVSSPATIPPQTAAAIRSALNDGRYQANGFPGCGEMQVAGPASVRRTATTAAGYVTIDVVDTCGSTSPNDPSYIAKELRFDNVLTGDYQSIDIAGGSNYAVGSPLVHIRAVPEGGPAGAALVGRQTNLPYTFYSRFINDQTVEGTNYSRALMNYDRRQPLPATFAARFVQSFPLGTTDYKIWREGRTGPVACTNASSNSALLIAELVRFDEHENSTVYDCQRFICIGPPGPRTLPAAARANTASGSFPVLSSPAGDIAGWMYLNLHSTTTTGGFDAEQHPNFGTRASQNWVVVAMSGGSSPGEGGLHSTEADATRLSSGCAVAIGTSFINGGPASLGPGPNQTP